MQSSGASADKDFLVCHGTQQCSASPRSKALRTCRVNIYDTDSEGTITGSGNGRNHHVDSQASEVRNGSRNRGRRRKNRS